MRLFYPTESITRTIKQSTDSHLFGFWISEETRRKFCFSTLPDLKADKEVGYSFQPFLEKVSNEIRFSNWNSVKKSSRASSPLMFQNHSLKCVSINPAGLLLAACSLIRLDDFRSNTFAWLGKFRCKRKLKNCAEIPSKSTLNGLESKLSCTISQPSIQFNSVNSSGRSNYVKALKQWLDHPIR